LKKHGNIPNQSKVRLQQIYQSEQFSPALSLPAIQALARPTNTRRRQHTDVGKASASAATAAMASESDIVTQATPAASRIIAVDDFVQSHIDARFNFNALEHHYNHNINAAWQKLDA
jgi:hypothetical protein